MENIKSARPSTFGFSDGKFYTRETLHVAMLRALGFKAERLDRDAVGLVWWCVQPASNLAQLTLEQAVTGIHDPSCLGGSDREKIAFAKAVQAHYATVLSEAKRAD